MDFLANLNSDLLGFYRSSYFDDGKNQTVYLATTQFQVTGARRAFPCFDEPIYKASFQVNLGRLKNMTSISNMPTESEGVPMVDNNIYVWDKYQTSPIMSTYLLAFVVFDFTFKQSETLSNGVQFRVWSRKGISDKTGLAEEAGPKILEFYEQHFNIKYPLPKMDLVAIPDFMGGMENWGLIIFEEKKLLFKPKESGATGAEDIVLIIAHELAHQWFGNLVTMEWWSE
jgi:aminopeptidase N